MEKEILQDREVYGLILAGGRSTRMGEDKTKLVYHDQPQLEYLHDLMSKSLSKVFISARPNQSFDFTDDIITDQYESKGPINGILSAMNAHPNKSFLVLAVDLPFINEGTILKLLNERDPSKIATAFATNASKLPEPLVALWEAEAYERLKTHHIENAMNCPRKFLINEDIKLVFPDEDLELFNANLPEEFHKAKSMIR